MDNNSQNTPQPQDNLSEPVPIMPPEPLQPQPQSTESISPAFQPTEPVPTMPVEPVQSQTQPQSVRQSPEKSAKKSNRILAIIVILVIMLISGVVSAYFIIQPKAEESMVASNPTLAEDKKTNDNSVSGENTSTADATSVLKPEDVTDKIKSHFAKTFTFLKITSN